MIGLLVTAPGLAGDVTGQPEFQGQPERPSPVGPSEQIDGDTPHFTNDIVPILTKAGCNTGVCHAKAGGGQNGFQLSLLGFEPDEDYDHLVREGRGRRLSPAAPDQSLLLLKATGRRPHGGGVRIEPDSIHYRQLHDWIAAGAPRGAADAPRLMSLEVQPPDEVLAKGASRQIRAIAHYSNDSERDVTSLALYESNQPAMLETSDSGRIDASDIPGKAAIMVRYQGHVAVYNAAIPAGATVAPLADPENVVDRFLFANLGKLGIPAASVCNDATFLRRATLDIAGRLPTVAEAESFLSSDDPERRRKRIDALLDSPDYADFFANKWTALLKNRRDDRSDITSNFAFHAWVRDSLLANQPYDQIVRQLLAATGTVIGNPPVAWYKRVKDPKQQIEDVAQLFLGVRMQCAQCHHHPFERWSQDDYYSLAAFFSQVGRKPTAVRGEDLIFHERGIAQTQNVKSGQWLRPAALGTDVGEIPAGEDPRLRLADWMSSADNPFFAKALVNRYWKHFFSIGLIEPEDDIRDTNPPTNPELLQALEQEFIASGFDLKQLIRVITTSRSYQLSSHTNELNRSDRQNYSHHYPTRLQAEVLLDAIDQLTGARTDFANLPIGTRAVALPDNSYNRSSPFLKVFGRPDSSSVCECERVQSASLAQSLHLLSASDIQNKLAFPGGRAERLSQSDGVSPENAVAELYLAAFGRYPSPSENDLAVHYLLEPRNDSDGKPLGTREARKQNLQDLIWALINTKEFMFNH
ncbi:DUF1549 domain-containing protein [Roseiconus nitratireducens]|uniref:DUF1549 domain-containing protein n=1 Tax=Roseiconus nitratireducens TaxID=2605748 RepID=A0A5M6D2V8_9BACT|nr:DUF1549 and DUF1553 domain-containing protein [Roseiconus nitratireducens]KAA5541847.1 DUF1549 domain-containing protein [Roseiconus nitratireducens]